MPASPVAFNLLDFREKTTADVLLPQFLTEEVRGATGSVADRPMLIKKDLKS